MNYIVRNTTRVLRGVFIFRLFLALFAALIFAIRWSVAPPPETHTPLNHFILFTLPTLGTMLFLFLPGLEKRMGRLYLPVALVLTTVTFSLEVGLNYIRPEANIIVSLPSGREVSMPWIFNEMILMVLVPCILTGATYGTRSALKMSGLATVLHLLTGVVVWLTNGPSHTFLALLPLRIGVLYAFSLLTGYLADTWRKEHTALQHANHQLRGYAGTIEHLATSRERVRLARAMHDTLAHTLTALVVQLEAVDALQETDPTAACSQLQKVKGQAREGLDEARKAIQDLRSSPVEEMGVSGAIEQLVTQFNHRSGIETEWHVEGSPIPLLPVQANALYRIVEEALNNVELHAEACQLEVGLRYNQGLTLFIQDDGRGFDPQTVGPDRYGLVGIRERATLVDAQVTVDSAPNRGTKLTVTIDEPWKE